MNTNEGSLDTLIQGKLDADTDFQATLTDLSDEDKDVAINTKKSELIEAEVKTLKEKADKATKSEELANNYKIRSEKAEAENKKLKGDGGAPTTPPEEKKDDLNSKDLYALMENKVSQEDVDEVIKASKILNKSIQEVLKDDVMKGILARRVEERKVADATNTGGTKRVSTKITGESLAKDAIKGEMPDSDEDIDKLVAHEMEVRKKAAKEGK